VLSQPRTQQGTRTTDAAPQRAPPWHPARRDDGLQLRQPSGNRPLACAAPFEDRAHRYGPPWQGGNTPSHRAGPPLQTRLLATPLLHATKTTRV
jgi:hypothetical protein